MSGSPRSAGEVEVMGLVGYVLIRRKSGDLQAKRIFDTEPEGPVVGSDLTQEFHLKNGDTVEGIIPAEQTRVDPATDDRPLQERIRE